jgi:hypothetical protein
VRCGVRSGDGSTRDQSTLATKSTKKKGHEEHKEKHPFVIFVFFVASSSRSWWLSHRLRRVRCRIEYSSHRETHRAARDICCTARQ